MQPTNSLKPNAFTVKAKGGGLLGIVISDITVQAPDSLSNLTIKAIWDTGADGTVITKDVAKKLLLSSAGNARIYTANGLTIRQIYRMNIALPNNVIFRNMIVGDVEVLSSGCDALIGMDIITLGIFLSPITKGIPVCRSECPPAMRSIMPRTPTMGKPQYNDQKTQVVVKRLRKAKKSQISAECVIPLGGTGWMVKNSNDKKFRAIWDSKREAVKIARSLAKHYGRELVIFAKDGSIQQQVSYAI